MNNIMEYKGYTGSVEFSQEDDVFFGKVLGIRSLLLYEGKSVQELKEDFHGVIDEYLEDCKEDNIQPEKPYNGEIKVRISPELHEKATAAAASQHVSLNLFIEEAIEDAVRGIG